MHTAALPGQKMERWKFTPLDRAVAGLALSGPPRAFVPAFSASPFAALSDIPPAWASASIKPETDPGDLTPWAQVLAAGGKTLVIDVPADTALEAPIDLRFTDAVAGAGTARIVIRLQENARACLHETHAAAGKAFKNILVQIVLASGARLSHLRAQEDGTETVHVTTTYATLAAGATYDTLSLNAGAVLSRHQIFADLTGPGAACRLAGIALLSGQRHGDTTILVDHRAPDCRSNQNYRHAVADLAHGVFQGKVHVDRCAQRTDGYQLSNAVLLSPRAVMDTKPELEIYADDVKCSHGATTGALDTAPLFYLRNRGIPERAARALLLRAFLFSAAGGFEDTNFLEVLTPRIERWLGDVL